MTGAAAAAEGGDFKFVRRGEVGWGEEERGVREGEFEILGVAATASVGRDLCGGRLSLSLSLPASTKAAPPPCELGSAQQARSDPLFFVLFFF